MKPKLIPIKRYNNWAEAELAKNFLAQQKIEAFIYTDDISAASPPDLINMTRKCRLLVKEEDAASALDLLK